MRNEISSDVPISCTLCENVVFIATLESVDRFLRNSKEVSIFEWVDYCPDITLRGTENCAKFNSSERYWCPPTYLCIHHHLNCQSSTIETYSTVLLAYWRDAVFPFVPCTSQPPWSLLKIVPSSSFVLSGIVEWWRFKRGCVRSRSRGCTFASYHHPGVDWNIKADKSSSLEVPCFFFRAFGIFVVPRSEVNIVVFACLIRTVL